MEEPFGAGSVSGVEVSGDDRLHYQQSWSPSGALLLHDGTVCWKGQEQTNQPGRNHLKLPLIEAELRNSLHFCFTRLSFY